MVATSRSILRCQLIGIAVACTLSVSVFATNDRVQQLVADLGAPEIMKREDAMRQLSEDASVTLPQLESLMADPKLSPEQRHRLAQAAKDRFFRSPRPALGVQFDQRLPDRVFIDRVYDKFPAFNLIQPGDLIVSCNGERLHSRTATLRLGAHIFAGEPGDAVTLEIRRGGEKITLDVPLGRFSDLDQRASGPGVDRLELAWELRLSRVAPPSREPIDLSRISNEARPDPSFIEVQKMNRFKAQMPSGYRAPRVVAGGEPRGGEYDYEELVVLQQNPNGNMVINRLLDQQQRLAQQGFGPGWTTTGVVYTTKQELSTLETRRLSLERELDRLKLPGLKPEQLVQLERDLAGRRQELERVERQIQAIQADAQELEVPPADQPADSR